MLLRYHKHHTLLVKFSYGRSEVTQYRFITLVDFIWAEISVPLQVAALFADRCQYSFFAGVFPKDVPFILHALLIRHYWNGAYYPVGGPSEITYHMTRIIERHGGRVLVQAPVTDILCDDSRKAIGECVGGQRLSMECVCILPGFLCGLICSISLLELHWLTT